MMYQVRKDTLPYNIAFIERSAKINLFDITNICKDTINENIRLNLISLNNGNGITEEKSQFNTLQLGMNELTLTQKYANGVVPNIDTIKISLLKEMIERNLFVKIVSKPNIKYFNNSEVGDVGNNDIKLAKQEILNMSLFNSLINNDTVIPRPLWIINNFVKGVSNIIIRVDTVESIKVYPDSNTYLINPDNGGLIITLNKEPMDFNNDGRFILDVTRLTGSDTIKGKALFVFNDDKLKRKDISMYNIMKNKFKPIIKLLYASDPVDTAVKQPNLKGITTPRYSTTTNYQLLDLLKSSIKKIYINGDSVIKNECVLISKLTQSEKDAIGIATTLGDTTGGVGDILNKLRRDPITKKYADTLKTNILSGTNNLVFNLRIFFKIQEADVSKYLLFNLSNESTLHKLSFTLLGSDKIEFGKTFYHELLHVYFPYTHQLEALTWLIITKASNLIKYNYKLGDELEKNGFCSAGTGHEMFNPENKFVCEGGASF